MISNLPSRRRVVATWLFGFLLPIVALLTESLFGWCAEQLFDPLPTLLHQLLVALVPFGYLIVLSFAASPAAVRRGLPWVLGAVGAISGLYAWPFLPFLGAAVVNTEFLGPGVLALAPLLSFFLASSWMHWLWQQHGSEGRAGLMLRWIMGVVVGLLLFGLADGRRIATHWAAERVASADVEEARRSVEFLRRWGDRGELQRLGRQSAWGSMFFAADLERDKARQVYYRVTGQLLADQMTGLEVVSSHLVAELDTVAPVGEVRWELVLRNGNAAGLTAVDLEARPLEATAEIALPSRGWVSAATLWDEATPGGGGTSHSAIFDDIESSRRAFQAAASAAVAHAERRTSLWIASAGPERAKLRLAPLFPGDEVRVKLTIQAPLDVVRAIEGRLDLPYFTQQNFRLADEAKHRIQLINPGRPIRFHTPQGLQNPFAMSDFELSRFETFVALRRDENATDFPVADGDSARLISVQAAKPRNWVVVVDGSATVAGVRDEVVQAVDALAAEWPKLDLVFAGDEVVTRPGEAGPGGGHWLASQEFAGGRDNAAALAHGVELAQAQQGAAVLWLGGPQPYSWGRAADFVQAGVTTSSPPVFVFPLAPGPQRLWDDFETATLQAATLPTATLQVVPRYGTLAEDLMRLPGMAPATPRFELRFDPRSVSTSPEAIDELVGATDSASRLARIRAGRDIQQLLRQGDASSRQEAQRLAVHYRLITPLSSAVVSKPIETQPPETQSSPEPPESVSESTEGPEPSNGI